MPETPEQLHARVAGALRMPPVEEWETFPFDGDMRPRPLAPPSEVDTPRRGKGGVDCDRCTNPDGEYFWTNDRWRLHAVGPSGLPLVAILEPRDHFAEPGDLPDELAAELGILLGRVERAIRALGKAAPGLVRIADALPRDGGDAALEANAEFPEGVPIALLSAQDQRFDFDPP